MPFSLVDELSSGAVGLDRVHFSHGGYAASFPFILKGRRKGEGDIQLTVVNIDKSEGIAGSLYYEIWLRLEQDSRLRIMATGSRQPVTIDEVTSHGGFGMVTMTDPVFHHFVRFSYHPKHYETGELTRLGLLLSTCNVGMVVPTPVPYSTPA